MIIYLCKSIQKLSENNLFFFLVYLKDNEVSSNYDPQHGICIPEIFNRSWPKVQCLTT